MLRLAFSTLALVALQMMLAISSANAALIGTCTFAGGCSPDIALVTTSAQFTTDGSGGTLVLSGTAGNVSFGPDELQDYSTGLTSVAIAAANFDGATGDNDYAFSISVDGAGNFENGSLTINGHIIDSGAGVSFPVNVPLWGHVFAPLFSDNGTALTGKLVDATLDQSGFQLNTSGGNISGLVMDFRFLMTQASVLAQADYTVEDTGAGLITMTNLSISDPNDIWASNWSAATTTFDVVVPIPGAAWLFGSALLGLIGFSRSKK